MEVWVGALRLWLPWVLLVGRLPMLSLKRLVIVMSQRKLTLTWIFGNNKRLVKPQPDQTPQQQLLLNRTLHGFEPNFLRPAPPTTQIKPYHFFWLTPQPLPQPLPLYDNSSVQIDRIESEYEQLIQNASEVTLNATQLKRVQFLLRADPSLCVRHRLKSGEEFQKCLESNRDFVESVLKTTIATNSADSGLIMEYLSSLVTVNASLNSLEVVGRLALEDGLPQEFLQTYFSHVINECLQLKDEGLQNRRVKLVCVMFLNLLKKQVMFMESNQELSAELMNFCIQFSNVSEATALFRLLRQSMNENDNQAGDSG
eukprot:TRINITY_DN4960_c1_g1_i1.p1 TRINITY_DN4960_c1_g1~~TRINITY_DN4960_c1_g1_i1.p1  ORF type:complete len:313 (-),score=41.22 TRINITY_DN4960_c1_g1_i1:362-1300(-)